MRIAVHLLLILFSYSLIGQVTVSTLVDNIEASGGLKVGTDDLIYAANFGESLNNANGTQVWRINPKTGQAELFANGLNGASGNDFDSHGNLFQSSIAAGTVSKINPQGQVSLFASDGISANVGIAIDDEDNLYVCNCEGSNRNTIRKVTPDGISTLFASGSLFNCPNGITIDKDQNLYVSNFSDGRIIKITPNGVTSLLAVTPGTSISAPSNGHIVYSQIEDVLYVASHGSHKIYRLTLDGTLLSFAGSSIRGNQDGPASQASFSRPNGLALSSSGDTLFVNSSIPITDVGGRPLNPSKIRIITGFLSASGARDQDIIEKVQIFPNPASDNINISTVQDQYKIKAIRIFSTMGNEIKVINLDKPMNKFLLDVSDLKNGIYYLELRIGPRTFIQAFKMFR